MRIAVLLLALIALVAVISVPVAREYCLDEDARRSARVDDPTWIANYRPFALDDPDEHCVRNTPARELISELGTKPFDAQDAVIHHSSSKRDL